ncbi:MAG: hypothetical protein ABL997_12465, partial [Planctomycetota bacterium]
LVDEPNVAKLLAPDRARLAEEVAKCKRQVATKEAEITQVEKHLQKNRDGLARTRATRCDPADPSRKHERIQDFNEEIEKDEKKLEKLRPEYDEAKAQFDVLKDRLSRFR